MWLHQCLAEEIITSLDLLGVLFLVQLSMLLAEGLMNALLPHQLVVHQVSCFFSAELLSKQSASSILV